MDKKDNKKIGSESAGTVFGNVSNAGTLYGEDKFVTPRGHGFAAERANHLYDKVTGKKAVLVGEDIDPGTGHIIKNGADRRVNGINIQTKYCKTGGKCISECFKDGKFRYLNADGSPMQIEVPSDKYEAALKAMEDRIKNGEVPGVKDPAEAKKIVRKGHFTYLQAKNIAKAGTVESIIYDSVNGAIIATSSFGISAALTFATSLWNGADYDVALKTATHSGLKVGGTTFVTAVLAGQLTKAGLNSALIGSSEAIIRVLGPKGSALIVNALRSGQNIYGAAAMKSAAKLLRGNVITSVASVVVLSSVDVTNIFRGRISGKQLFKNVTATTASVAGGTAGWLGGAAMGAAAGSAVPIIGTAIGGFVGGLLGAFAGGAASGKVAEKTLDIFIEDDADAMVRIIEEEFKNLSEEYLLTADEAEKTVNILKGKLDGKTLKNMFASSNRKIFANNLLIPCIEEVTNARQKITMPSEEESQKCLVALLEEIAEKVEDGSAEAQAADAVKTDELISTQEYSVDDINYRAMLAIIVYFSECDGNVSAEENEIIMNMVSELPQKTDSSAEIIDEIFSIDDFTFDVLCGYLEAVSKEKLIEFKDLVNSVIDASDGVNPAEVEAKTKFENYVLTR